MNPINVRPPLRLTPLRRRLIALGLVLLALALMANDCPYNKKTNSSADTRQVARRLLPRRNPRIEVRRVPRTDGRIEFTIQGFSNGDPLTQHITLSWHCHYTIQDIQISGDGEVLGHGAVWPLLPTNTYGETPQVTVTYTPPAGVTKVVDEFTARSNSDVLPATQAVTTLLGGSADRWLAGAAQSPPAAAAARLDDYYLWETTMWYGAPGLTMTVDLCQDGVGLLQSDAAFVALRFPVQPPSLAYTDPYTLPVCFGGGYSPYLALLDERAIPAVPLLTTTLEYKPRYLTFAENELPAAPGEHWLTLGAVTSPALDCAGLPALLPGEWELQANVWLDFDGGRDVGRGAVLPLYYCYEGQAPPGPLVGADVASYQGWNITCLGPHYLTLRDGPDD